MHPIKRLIGFSPEMDATIDAARGTIPRGPWIEARLRKLAVIQRTAETEGIELPHRPDDSRGTHDREK